jgi:hypothetical protein
MSAELCEVFRGDELLPEERVLILELVFGDMAEELLGEMGLAGEVDEGAAKEAKKESSSKEE